MPIWDAFIGPAYTPQSLRAGSEELVNLYVEQQASPGSDPRFVYLGVPGLTSITAAFSGEVGHRAAFHQDGRAFVVVGGVYAEISSAGVASVIGAVANDSLPATISTNGQAGHQNFIVSGGQGYIHDLTSGAFTRITDPDFPSGRAVMGVYFESYFVVLTSTEIRISARLDGLTWNGADIGQRTISADNLVALAVTGRVLWLLGTLKTEGWQNTSATFPLAPISGAQFDAGCMVRATVVPFDNSIAWVGQNSDGDRVLLMVQQYGASRFSTHAVEASLRACTTLTDFRAYAYQDEGHAWYVLTSDANKLTWAFDAAVPPPYAWAKRGSWNAETGVFYAQRAATHLNAFGQHWVGDRSTGTLYRQSLDLFDDNGKPIRRLRRAPHVRKGPRSRLFYPSLRLNVESGVGTATGQGADPQLLLRCSDDGGKTFGNELSSGIGKVGQYQTAAEWTRLGSAFDRVFEVSQTDPVKTAWIEADLAVEAGL